VQRVVDRAATAEAACSGTLLAQFVVEGLRPAALVDGLNAAERDHLDRPTDQQLGNGQLRNLLLYGPGGRVVYASAHERDGQVLPVSEGLAAAYAGRLQSHLEHESGPETSARGNMLEVYLPLALRAPGGGSAVLELNLSYGEPAARAQ
jgi:hypothetical protein